MAFSIVPCPNVRRQIAAMRFGRGAGSLRGVSRGDGLRGRAALTWVLRLSRQGDRGGELVVRGGDQCGVVGSAHPGPAKAFIGFVVGQAGNGLSGGVLALGVEGPRPDARGPAAP